MNTVIRDYTIQIPEYIFNRRLTHQNQDESPSILSQVSVSQPQSNAIPEAIKSIGGFGDAAKE